MSVLPVILWGIFEAFFIAVVTILGGRIIYKITKQEGFSIFSGFVLLILAIIFFSYNSIESLLF